MSAYLDLDDVCAGNPKAQEELKALRDTLKEKDKQIKQYAENETEREKELMEQIANLKTEALENESCVAEWQKAAYEATEHAGDVERKNAKLLAELETLKG